MDRLTVAAPGPLAVREREIRLADKTVSGLRAYAQRWHGDVALAVALSDDEAGSANLGARWYSVDELPFAISAAPTVSEAIRRTKPDIIMANLTGRIGQMEEFIEQCVLLAEFDPVLQSKEARHGTRGVDRARAMVGAGRRANEYRRYVRRARGLQCNGLPAYRALGGHNPASILFFDSRLGEADVEAAAACSRQGRPNRFAFSGRLHSDKGADFLVGLADQLRHMGVHLDVFGDGELRQQLESSTGANVTFHGEVDYSSVWLPYVRSSVDVMVLPHTQSDPSCTYLESIGSGVPVLGFDNAALQSLVDRFGIGWTVPMRDGAALARSAQELHAAPRRIVAAREAGFAMMREHHADATFDARIAHLQSLI